MNNAAVSYGHRPASRVALLADIATHLLVEDRPEEIVPGVFTRVAAQLDLDLFVNHLVAGDGRTLRLAGCGGLTQDQAARLEPPAFGEGVCSTVAAGREPVVVERVDRSADPVNAVLRSLGVRAYACHALRGRHGLVGALSFGSRARDTFSTEDLELMQAVASQVAVALERARAVRELQSELRERAEIQQALTETQQSLNETAEQRRIALEIAQLGNWDLDLATGRIRGDERAAEIFGLDALGVYSIEDVVGRLHPEDRDRVRREIEAALDPDASGLYDTHYRVGHGDRATRWVHARGRAIGAGDGEARRLTRFIGTIMDVTVPHSAEQEVRDARDLLQGVLDAAPTAVVVTDKSGGILFANTATVRILGGGVTGDADGPSGEYTLTMVDGSPVPRGRMPLSRALAGETVWDTELLVTRTDGSRSVILAGATPLRAPGGDVSGAVTAFQDITDRKRAERELRDQRDFISAVLDTAASLVIVLDAEGRIVRFNNACQALSGYGQDEVVGRSYEMLIPRDEQPFVHDALERIVSGACPGENENHWEARDGSRRLLAWSNTVIRDERGAVKFIVSTGIDVTERKRAEEGLREANRRLAETDRRKDEFIAILSHELRNPLAPIRFALPVVERERLSKPATRAVAVIDRQLGHLTRLVDDLLDASRVTGGKIELRRERVALDAVLTAATEAASPAIFAARHTLKLAVAGEPISLHGDPGRLAQVLTNLLNNSAKYTPRGGNISVEARRDGAHAVITVRDTGIGIPGDALPTVFDMFRQVDSPERAQGGLGIGLALARQLVELHGGTIEARSAGVGHGAEFVVRLPLAAEEPVPTAARNGAAPCTPAASKALKVLVVDDNADLVEMLATLVDSLGHDVRKALDGQSAIAAALSYRPDVILLDLGLPVMSGLDVARELRRHQALATTRLVALTGWGQAEDRRRTEEAGFDQHLTKPADPDTLARLLADFSTSIKQ